MNAFDHPNVCSIRIRAYRDCSMATGAGNPCEAAVLAAFVAGGFDVLLPFGEGHPYDLVVAIDATYLRVQCKTAWATSGGLVFNAYATDHGRGQRSYVGDADVFGVYFPPSRAIYLVPVGLVETECRLRLEPARNNQTRRVRFAYDYEFERWTPAALVALATQHPAEDSERRLDPANDRPQPVRAIRSSSSTAV